MDFVGGLIGLGIILAFIAFLIIFGGVEKEDPYITHSIKKKPHPTKKSTSPKP